MIRQGDVLLIPIKSFPKRLKEKDLVIARGEATGHHHRFSMGQVQVFQDREGQQFVSVKKPSRLVHEEHKEVKIPKGKYRVVIQREFDILNDNIRKVLD